MWNGYKPLGSIILEERGSRLMSQAASSGREVDLEVRRSVMGIRQASGEVEQARPV